MSGRSAALRQLALLFAVNATHSHLSSEALKAFFFGQPRVEVPEALIDRLEGKIPFELSDGAVRIADSLFVGEGLFLWTCFPNPWNPERYLVLRVGPGDLSQGQLDTSQDFVLSRRIEDPDTGSVSFQVLAQGIFEKRDGNWSLPASEFSRTIDLKPGS